MIFDSENKRKRGIKMNSFSQSFGGVYDECPAKAWYKLRNKNIKETNEAMELGAYAHQLFAKKVSKRFLGETRRLQKKGVHPSIMFQANQMIEKTSLSKIVEEGDEVIGVEQFAKHTLRNGIELIGIFDLILLKGANTNKPYIQIFDLKTSRKLDKEVNLQCMIYVYLAAIMFPGLPIHFQVYSARTNDEWGRFFSERDALAMEDHLLEYSSEIKADVEGEYTPIAKASPKCQTCPFLSQCVAGLETEERDIAAITNQLQIAKVAAKIAEAKLKELLNNTDEPVLDTGTGFQITMKNSSYPAIKSKITKDNLKLLLASGDGLNSIIDSLDLKLTPKVIQKAMDLGIEFRDVCKQSFAIVSSEPSEEEGEGGEDNE